MADGARNVACHRAHASTESQRGMKFTRSVVLFVVVVLASAAAAVAHLADETFDFPTLHVPG